MSAGVSVCVRLKEGEVEREKEGEEREERGRERCRNYLLTFERKSLKWKPLLLYVYV